jgi:hypothetical protein
MAQLSINTGEMKDEELYGVTYAFKHILDRDRSPSGMSLAMALRQEIRDRHLANLAKRESLQNLRGKNGATVAQQRQS